MPRQRTTKIKYDTEIVGVVKGRGLQQMLERPFPILYIGLPAHSLSIISTLYFTLRTAIGIRWSVRLRDATPRGSSTNLPGSTADDGRRQIERMWRRSGCFSILTGTFAARDVAGASVSTACGVATWRDGPRDRHPMAPRRRGAGRRLVVREVMVMSPREWVGAGAALFAGALVHSLLYTTKPSESPGCFALVRVGARGANVVSPPRTSLCCSPTVVYPIISLRYEDAILLLHLATSCFSRPLSFRSSTRSLRVLYRLDWPGALRSTLPLRMANQSAFGNPDSSSGLAWSDRPLLGSRIIVPIYRRPGVDSCHVRDPHGDGGGAELTAAEHVSAERCLNRQWKGSPSFRFSIPGTSARHHHHRLLQATTYSAASRDLAINHRVCVARRWSCG